VAAGFRRVRASRRRPSNTANPGVVADVRRIDPAHAPDDGAKAERLERIGVTRGFLFGLEGPAVPPGTGREALLMHVCAAIDCSDGFHGTQAT